MHFLHAQRPDAYPARVEYGSCHFWMSWDAAKASLHIPYTCLPRVPVWDGELGMHEAGPLFGRSPGTETTHTRSSGHMYVSIALFCVCTALVPPFPLVPPQTPL